MSGDTVPQATRSNEAHVRTTDDELLGPVLTRVVAMLAARADIPLDQLDDALLLTDALAAQAPRHAGEGRPTSITVRTDDEGLELIVTDLEGDAAERLLAEAELPEVGNVLQKVADDVHTRPDALAVRLRF